MSDTAEGIPLKPGMDGAVAKETEASPLEDEERSVARRRRSNNLWDNSKAKRSSQKEDNVKMAQAEKPLTTLTPKKYGLIAVPHVQAG